MDNFEKYITFKNKKIRVYFVTNDCIKIQLYKHVYYKMPYTEEWYDYIRQTSLQVFPKRENILKIIRKLHNMKILPEPQG